MEIIYALVPLALALGLFFLGLFIWATKSGQYDDLDTPAQRILIEDQEIVVNKSTERTKK